MFLPEINVFVIKKCTFFFKSSKELTLVIRSGKAQNSGYPKLYGIKADHGRDFHPLADHDTVTKFHQGREFSAFPFSLQ